MVASHPRDALLAPARASRARRAGLLASVLAAGAVAVSLLLPAGAPASVSGCTYTTVPIDFVCFGIRGKSTHVTDFWVTRNRNGPSNSICNSHAEVWVKEPNGRQVFFHRTKKHLGCAAVRRAWRITTVNRHFAHNSQACGAAYENGQLQAIACRKILR